MLFRSQSLNSFTTKINNSLIRSPSVFPLQGLNRLFMNCRFILQIFTLMKLEEKLERGPMAWYRTWRRAEFYCLLFFKRLVWFECVRVISLVKKSQFCWKAQKSLSPWWISLFIDLRCRVLIFDSTYYSYWFEILPWNFDTCHHLKSIYLYRFILCM